MTIQQILLLLCTVALLPSRSHGVEILEADADLSARISGDPNVDVQFGTAYFHGLHPGIYMLGTFYEPESREASTVLGFRLTEAFLREWKEQGEAHLLFSIIRFEIGDPRKICPIHVELLDANHTSAMTAACRSRQPRPRLGSITRDDLKEDHLYSFPITLDPALKPGDTLWIGLDCTNPFEPEDHNLIISGDLYLHPGGAPPILIAGSPEATSQTVHGMSLLQSLNRRFSTPESGENAPAPEPVVPSWVNPFRTSHKMDTLEEFRMTLEQQLEKLPDCPVIVPDQFSGFHSSIKPTNETWALRFPVRDKESSIALYPAARWNGNEPVAYAFPKRFVITAIPRSRDDPPVIVADWSEADFPHQGLRPVIFPFTWGNYRELRMMVLKGVPMPGGHAFALAEVSFSHIDDTDLFHLLTDPENSLEAPPYWSTAYATDGQTPFGSPIPSTDASAGTFRTFPNETNRPQIIIRQPEPTIWDSFEFYPTPYANGTPPQGFPTGFRIDFSDLDDFSRILSSVHTTGTVTLRDADHPYVFRFTSVSARNVRITLDPPANTPEGRLLQLEEITFDGGFPLVQKNMDVELAGISGAPDPSALYDQMINGNPLHSPLRRTVNLIRREVLGNELQRVEHTMLAIRKAHEHTLGSIKATIIILAVALFGWIIMHQRRQARKTQRRIRGRIQQDLHDEIGSQLSAISLIADMDKEAPELPNTIRTDLRDVHQCAREAIASLTEVVWLTNEEILTLDQCLEVMQKRARQMVHTIKLELDFPKHVPRLELSYKTKRNLILLFTEALNNALKHSNADLIHAGVQLNGSRNLTVTVHDNGQGFQSEGLNDGIGLKSMNERARTLGGKLEISSSPENGTTIRFEGKL